MLAKREATAEYCFQKAELVDRDWLVTLEIGEIYLHYEQASGALLVVAPGHGAGTGVYRRLAPAGALPSQAGGLYAGATELSDVPATGSRPCRGGRRVCAIWSRMAGAGWLRRAVRRWMGR